MRLDVTFGVVNKLLKGNLLVLIDLDLLVDL